MSFKAHVETTKRGDKNGIIQKKRRTPVAV